MLTQISNDFQRIIVSRQTLADAAQRGQDTVLLTYREEPNQPRRPITGLLLLEFSPVLES